MTMTIESPFIERNCTIEHNGRTFESGSAALFGDRAIAYLSPDMRRVTSWRGEDIGPAHVVSSWPIPHSWISSRQYQVEATINGRTYTGRTMGGGMLWRGKVKAAR